MLKVAELEKALTRSLSEVLPSALEEAYKHILPVSSNKGNEMAKDFGQTISDLISEPLGQRFANAIDYYIKNADVYGKLITNGSPSTHMCSIESPSPLTNGKVPNTLGIK